MGGRGKGGGGTKKWKREGGAEGGGEGRGRAPRAHSTLGRVCILQPGRQPLVTASKLFFAFLSSQPTLCAIWISWSKNIPQTSQSAGMGRWTRVLIRSPMFSQGSFFPLQSYFLLNHCPTVSLAFTVSRVGVILNTNVRPHPEGAFGLQRRVGLGVCFSGWVVLSIFLTYTVGVMKCTVERLQRLGGLQQHRTMARVSKSAILELPRAMTTCTSSSVSPHAARMPCSSV